MTGPLEGAWALSRPPRAKASRALRAPSSRPSSPSCDTGRNTRFGIPRHSGIAHTSTADIAPLQTARPWALTPFGASRGRHPSYIGTSSSDAVPGQSTRTALLSVVCPSRRVARHCGSPHCGRPQCPPAELRGPGVAHQRGRGRGGWWGAKAPEVPGELGRVLARVFPVPFPRPGFNYA